MQSVCKFCGKEFLHRADHLNKYCSLQCAGKSRRKKPKVCPVCNKKFIGKSHHNKQVHCSRKCSTKARIITKKQQRIKVKCYTCGNEFKKQPCRLKKYNFCSPKCRCDWRKTLKPEDAGHYKGGIIKQNGGYLFKLIGKRKYKAVQRIEMEKFLGRKLSPNEIVHHKNEDIIDNRIKNLEILTRSEHAKLHRLQ